MTHGPFSKTPGWLDYVASPSRPRFRLPPGSVDAHCHVFGPGSVFPYAPERKYTPGDAPKDALFALRDVLGFGRNVIVQATCHGTDNSALLDAIAHAGGRARGVASVRLDIAEHELRALHEGGVRGVRFNFVKRLAEAPPREALQRLAQRVAALGWHIVLYFEPQDLASLYEFLIALPAPLVIDHMGRPDVTQPITGSGFALLVRLLEELPASYCKVTCPERLSRSGPPAYADVVPFAARIVERFPERVLWGTDWPHPNMTTHMPDDGQLVDFIPRIAPREDQQRKLLVDNPMRLYWPEEGQP
jgi:2-pyrone-4,6-dicarboxylate lactonase